MGKHKRLRRPRAIKGFDTHDREVVRAKRTLFGASRIGRPYVDPDAPHFRYIARAFALPGKHMRQALAPLKAAHCKDE